MIALGLSPVFASTFSLTVSSNQGSYSQGNAIWITGRLTSSNIPVSSVPVSVTVEKPSSTMIFVDMPETNTNGQFSTAFTLPQSATLGTYTIYAAYSTASAENAFLVLPVMTTSTTSSSPTTGTQTYSSLTTSTATTTSLPVSTSTVSQTSSTAPYAICCGSGNYIYTTTSGTQTQILTTQLAKSSTSTLTTMSQAQTTSSTQPSPFALVTTGTSMGTAIPQQSESSPNMDILIVVVVGVAMALVLGTLLWKKRHPRRLVKKHVTEQPPVDEPLQSEEVLTKKRLEATRRTRKRPEKQTQELPSEHPRDSSPEEESQTQTES